MNRQAAVLSNNLRTFSETNTLVSNSRDCEMSLEKAVKDVVEYARDIAPGGYIFCRKTMSLSELKVMLGLPNSERDNRTFISPDGGFVFWEYKGKQLPILISEDKYQGTNDNRYCNDLPRQALGNAIERAGKNINAVKPLFMDKYDIFPYALFCAGCDFHSSETISSRVECINCYKPNHYIEMTPKKSKYEVEADIYDNIAMNINIKKWKGEYCASTFIKAHNWKEMPNGASKWTSNERLIILKYVVKQAMVYYDSLFG